MMWETALEIRKIITAIEDVLSDEGNGNECAIEESRGCCSPNPCAGKYFEDLSVLIDGSAEVGGNNCISWQPNI